MMNMNECIKTSDDCKAKAPFETMSQIVCDTHLKALEARAAVINIFSKLFGEVPNFDDDPNEPCAYKYLMDTRKIQIDTLEILSEMLLKIGENL